MSGLFRRNTFPLGRIFQGTLAYLILQAGFLVGYGVHDGPSALKSYQVLSPDSALFDKVFGFSKTAFDHKNLFKKI